jgi:two-component system, NarL family, sensor kinase
MYNTKTAALIFLIFITAFILVMITFIIIILFFIQKKQKSFVLDLMATKAHHEKELLNTRLEIHEQTIQEVSRELHDNVGQYLSLAKLGLSTLDLERKDESKNSLVEISDIIEKSLDDLRNVCRSMNTEIIKEGGLKKSIEMQVDYIKRAGKFNIHFKVNGDHVVLDETKETVLFRIVQEAINNIIRHSAATEVCISLCYSENLLKLQIQDDGKGFNLNEQNSGTNHINGIRNMQQRAKFIEADFQFESKIGDGTKIIVTTPY